MGGYYLDDKAYKEASSKRNCRGIISKRSCIGKMERGPTKKTADARGYGGGKKTKKRESQKLLAASIPFTAKKLRREKKTGQGKALDRRPAKADTGRNEF